MRAKWQAQRTPGDPFNRVLDQLDEFVQSHPESLPSAHPHEASRSYLASIADRFRHTLAARLDDQTLNQDNVLTVSVVDHWEINASVAQKPPYAVQISTNLWQFCATMSELFISGLTMDVTGDDNTSIARVDAASSHTEIAVNVRRLLHSFVTDQTIPPIESKRAAAHFTMHHVAFLSTMAFVVGHEFGHVVIRQLRNAGKKPPFENFADFMLTSHYAQIVKDPRHDPAGRAKLASLDPAEAQQVRTNWLTEINADILGASLAAEYMRDQGPYRGKPQILGWTYVAIHLCLMAQMFLYAYWRIMKPDLPMISRTHPPIDFRTHSVLMWMYKDQMQEATEGLVQYCQGIMMEALTLKAHQWQ